MLVPVTAIGNLRISGGVSFSNLDTEHGDFKVPMKYPFGDCSYAIVDIELDLREHVVGII